MSSPYPTWVAPQPPFDTANTPSNGPFWPTLWPPPTQGLAIAYLRPRLARNGIPVATRLPKPSETADTVNGFIRLESAGGKQRPDDIMFDVGILIHSYAPNNQESMAEINCMTAMAHLGNAQGRWVVHNSLQRPWYVTYSRISGCAVKQSDPLVNLTRFKALVMWRVPGMNDPLPNDVDYGD